MFLVILGPDPEGSKASKQNPQVAVPAALLLALLRLVLVAQRREHCSLTHGFPSPHHFNLMFPLQRGLRCKKIP